MVYAIVLFYTSKNSSTPDYLNLIVFNDEIELEKTVLEDFWNKKTFPSDTYYLKVQIWSFSPTDKCSLLLCEKEFINGIDVATKKNDFEEERGVILSFEECKKIIQEDKNNRYTL